jgi:hypothetical protein
MIEHALSRKNVNPFLMVRAPRLTRDTFTQAVRDNCGNGPSNLAVDR